MTPIAVDANDPYAVREALASSAAHGAANSALNSTAEGAANSAANGTADAVVLAVRTTPVDQPFLVGATRTVLDIAAQLGLRVLVVGGAGALPSPDDGELLVADNPAYVPGDLKTAAAGIAQLRTCQAHGGADGSI
ncbi:putative NADH-flavin reductase [Streptomyces zagrosensis]|uniref:Putative NADH-flavin reductase n=1 Tax=Streptomyces zagrosensis TaxID=1042984 RepID=A0A7W9V0M2_9ACTN|nr:putative NADH-flavin reductase [Streptomyces zagrosensis]